MNYYGKSFLDKGAKKTIENRIDLDKDKAVNTDFSKERILNSQKEKDNAVRKFGINPKVRTKEQEEEREQRIKKLELPDGISERKINKLMNSGYSFEHIKSLDLYGSFFGEIAYYFSQYVSKAKNYFSGN